MNTFKTKIKTYTCSRTHHPNGIVTFKCSCPAWSEALNRKVPCKHILSLLFCDGNVKKWEDMRKSFANQFTMSLGASEVILGKGLRNKDQRVLNWVAGYNKAMNPPRQFMMGEI